VSPAVDVLRGLTLYESVPILDPERTTVAELCPGAHVYSVRLCATAISAEFVPLLDPDSPLATLVLQDSEIRVYPGCCEFFADYRGVRWPSFARLRVRPGVRAVLTLTYGHCA
jgi:hypothetical protein